MKHLSTRLLLLLLLLLPACSDTATPTEGNANEEVLNYFRQDWAMQDLWNDGSAEYAIYEATREIYGKLRQFDYTIITVKETFNEEHWVKTDDYDREDLFEVMKVNMAATIPTENYPYHYLTSVFTDRQTPLLLMKLTNGSQEYCGNTFKTIVPEEDYLIYHYNSYFDGQGIGNQQLPRTQVFLDQLGYSLRALEFRPGLEFTLPVYPSIISNVVDVEQEPVRAVITVAEQEPVQVMEEAVPAWPVNVELGNGLNRTYWFGAEYPNILLRMEDNAGNSLLLKRIERNQYWERE